MDTGHLDTGHLDTKCDIQYDCNMRFQVIAIYIMAIVVWVVIIVTFKMNRAPAIFVIIIPFILFMVSASCGWSIDDTSRKYMFQTPIVTICIIISVQFVMWIIGSGIGSDRHLLALVTLAVSLALASLIDLWSTPEHIAVWNHIRHACQTMAVTVILYAIIEYCTSRPS